MEDHMTGHNKEKRYECDVCGKAYQKPSRLEAHRRVHTGERPFDCSECGMSFTRYDKLLQHNRVHSVREALHLPRLWHELQDDK
ncbi:zinc finger protein 829-like [Leucoraja erinacea]|uniref:zinc finger protein 829-like n=1 Tax=Leucoraja erinaceus TaxID=7782 RepID=UPI002455D7AC|nr:zinc finger protein 829-like [Leucoraja erinacea]